MAPRKKGTGKKCALCQCTRQTPRCSFCCETDFKCTGTCDCCQEYRAQNLPSTSTVQPDVPPVDSSKRQHKCHGGGACNCFADEENEGEKGDLQAGKASSSETQPAEAQIYRRPQTTRKNIPGTPDLGSYSANRPDVFHEPTSTIRNLQLNRLRREPPSTRTVVWDVTPLIPFAARARITVSETMTSAATDMQQTCNQSAGSAENLPSTRSSLPTGTTGTYAREDFIVRSLPTFEEIRGVQDERLFVDLDGRFCELKRYWPLSDERNELHTVLCGLYFYTNICFHCRGPRRRTTNWRYYPLLVCSCGNPIHITRDSIRIFSPNVHISNLGLDVQVLPRMTVTIHDGMGWLRPCFESESRYPMVDFTLNVRCNACTRQRRPLIADEGCMPFTCCQCGRVARVPLVHDPEHPEPARAPPRSSAAGPSTSADVVRTRQYMVSEAVTQSSESRSTVPGPRAGSSRPAMPPRRIVQPELIVISDSRPPQIAVSDSSGQLETLTDPVRDIQHPEPARAPPRSSAAGPSTSSDVVRRRSYMVSEAVTQSSESRSTVPGPRAGSCRPAMLPEPIEQPEVIVISDSRPPQIAVSDSSGQLETLTEPVRDIQNRPSSSTYFPDTNRASSGQHGHQNFSNVMQQSSTQRSATSAEISRSESSAPIRGPSAGSSRPAMPPRRIVQPELIVISDSNESPPKIDVSDSSGQLETLTDTVSDIQNRPSSSAYVPDMNRAKYCSFCDCINDDDKCNRCKKKKCRGSCACCNNTEQDPYDWTSESPAKRARTSKKGRTTSVTTKGMSGDSVDCDKKKVGVTTRSQTRRKLVLTARTQRLTVSLRRCDEFPSGGGAVPDQPGSVQRSSPGGPSVDEEPLVRAGFLLRNLPSSSTSSPSSSNASGSSGQHGDPNLSDVAQETSAAVSPTSSESLYPPSSSTSGTSSSNASAKYCRYCDCMNDDHKCNRCRRTKCRGTCFCCKNTEHYSDDSTTSNAPSSTTSGTSSSDDFAIWKQPEEKSFTLTVPTADIEAFRDDARELNLPIFEGFSQAVSSRGSSDRRRQQNLSNVNQQGSTSRADTSNVPSTSTPGPSSRNVSGRYCLICNCKGSDDLCDMCIRNRCPCPGCK